MTIEQFNVAMAAIARHHSTHISVNVPKNNFVGNLGKSEYSIHITQCCASLVANLEQLGYSLSMDADGLNVDRY